MRRRALLSAIATSAAVGTAGCTGSDSRDAAGSGGPTTDATAAQTTGGAETSTADGDEPILRFGDRIGDETRERCRRALDRTRDITGAELAAPVRIEMRDPVVRTELRPQSPFEIAVSKATHLLSAPRPDRFPGSLGSYHVGERVIELTDVSQLDVESLTAQEATPDATLENYPNEPHVAHELTHAVQHDVADRGGDARTVDGTNAGRSLTEGIATYVEGRYRANCVDGDYDPCVTLESFGRAVDVPLWMLPRRMPYVNGALFAHRVVENGGWGDLWDRYESPPDVSAAIMFPEEYLDTGIAYEADVAVPDEASDPWSRTGSTRLGVFPLYQKLFSLGVVSLDDPDAAVDDEAAATLDLPRVYRSEMLRGWRGDALVGYEGADGAVGYRWETEWASADDAEQVVGTVAGAYDRRGQRHDVGWFLDEDVVTAFADGTTVTFAGGPTGDAVRAILGG